MKFIALPFLILFSATTQAATWMPSSRLLPDGTACTVNTNLQFRWNNTTKQVEVCYSGMWNPAFPPPAGGSSGSLIGGGYVWRTNYPQQCSVSNPITGVCSCPNGYTAAPVSAANGSADWFTGYLCFK